MRYLLALLLLLTFQVSAFGYSEMTPYDGCVPSEYSCEFYKCEEEKRNCGAKGYPLNFGYRFCKKFLDGNNSSFTGRGQKWLYEVRECLQKKMQEISYGSTCDEVANDAFEAHIPCYYETGFCYLSMADKVKVFYRLKASFVKAKVIMSGISVLKGCFTPEEQALFKLFFMLETP